MKHKIHFQWKLIIFIICHFNHFMNLYITKLKLTNRRVISKDLSEKGIMEIIPPGHFLSFTCRNDPQNIPLNRSLYILFLLSVFQIKQILKICNFCCLQKFFFMNFGHFLFYIKNTRKNFKNIHLSYLYFRINIGFFKIKNQLKSAVLKRLQNSSISESGQKIFKMKIIC